MKLHRIALFCGILFAGFLLFSACDGKQAKEPDPREMQINALRTKLTEMESSANAIQVQLTEAKNIQMQLSDRISGMQSSLDQLTARAVESRTALNSLSQAEQNAKAREGRGWPWLVRILLILALLVVFYFIYRKVVRGSDVDDEAADEGFVEETELGTVRYPGSKSDASRKKE